MFRQIERWLHQHIFKVGWLLSNNFQITTILYYIIFLPGIILHEAVLWLAASLLNVRAERSIGFPEPQEIGELRLNFIRLAEDAGRAKRLVIKLCPVAAGMAALWAIAAHVFQWEALLKLVADGSLDSLVEAVAMLTRTADVWLWFYLAFVIANTMIPTFASRSDRREKALVFCASPFLALGIWRVAGGSNPAIASFIEALLGSIGLIIGQITFVNLCAVLVLGTVEALIEGLSNRSASFRDGKMITMSDQEARQIKLNQQRGSSKSQVPQLKPRSAPPLNSIYEIKLPIPGPPGREPVSRSAVAVFNPDEIATGQSPEEGTPAPGSSGSGKDKQSLAQAKPVSADSPTRAAQDREKDILIMPLEDREDAPFDRPFVNWDSAGNESEEWQATADMEEAEPFTRPFVMASRGSDIEAESLIGEPDSRDGPDVTVGSAAEDKPGQHPERTAKRQSRTRPAPKPSERKESVSEQAEDGDDRELKYVAFDDDDPYIDGDEFLDHER